MSSARKKQEVSQAERTGELVPCPSKGAEESTTPASRQSRRSLLKLLGATAVGLVGGLGARSAPARAADGDPLAAGQHNTATSKTSLQTSGTITDDGAFVVDAPAADWAIEGSSGNLGVYGNGYIGVYGSGDYGASFSGNLAAINLQPQPDPDAPTSGDYAKGDMLVDANGVLFLCVADGNPGTWIKVSHGGVRPLASPQRAYDSRNTADGRLAGNGATGSTGNPRVVQITSAIPAIPANAVAVVGNLAITAADGNGFATIWPSGSWPGTANINFSTGDLSNSFTVALGAGGVVSVAASTPTHVIIDIAGYVL